MKKKKETLVKCNRFRAGSVRYYRDALHNIWAVTLDYNGYNPRSAKRMRDLIDEIRETANGALAKEKLYLKFIKEEKK